MDHPAVVLHLTLDQRDQLYRLLRTLIAHGDVIAMSKSEWLEAQTLPTLGQAIFDAAHAVREMLEQRVEQRPGRSYLHAADGGEVGLDLLLPHLLSHDGILKSQRLASLRRTSSNVTRCSCKMWHDTWSWAAALLRRPRDSQACSD